MTVVYRPVEASPPQMNEVVIDPATGKFTQAGHRRITELWKRTGGFTDDLGALIGIVGLSQISSLTASSNEEKTRRILSEALQQIQGQNVERLRSLFDDFRKTTDTNFAQLLGGLGRPPPTRVVQFSASDEWRLNPDIRALSVFVVGGGGGGAGGTASSNGGGGGGGANYSLAFIEASLLPSSVTVTVGAAGTAGAAGGNGGAGGNSSFGSFCAAKGGYGGLATGAAGALNDPWGGMFVGGNGGAGSASGDGQDADNDHPGAPGGGGGAFYNGTNATGGAGGTGNSRSLSPTGGGGSGGLGTGTSGGSNPISATFLGPGFGGGGGGSSATVSGTGGDGFNGAGGGGGAARASNARPGGAGGAGRVWVLEYY
jgi:hypothetical protein